MAITPTESVAFSNISTTTSPFTLKGGTYSSPTAPIDTREERTDNSPVVLNAGKILWENARAAGLHQPL